MDTNESQFYFTQDAWNVYQPLTPSQRQVFWDRFYQQRFIDRGELIMWFMAIECVDETKELPETSRPVNLESLKINDMSAIFIAPTHIYYQGIPFSCPFDFEYAESVFSVAEDAPNQSIDGHQWWEWQNRCWKTIKADLPPIPDPF